MDPFVVLFCILGALAVLGTIGMMLIAIHRERRGITRPRNLGRQLPTESDQMASETGKRRRPRHRA